MNMLPDPLPATGAVNEQGGEGEGGEGTAAAQTKHLMTPDHLKEDSFVAAAVLTLTDLFLKSQAKYSEHFLTHISDT